MSERAEGNPKTIKIPGPDHPITIERNVHRIRAGHPSLRRGSQSTRR
jgi:hypothetical protein